MAEIINLRTARKRAEREKSRRQAEANRAAHGVSHRQRDLDAARRDQASRGLDGHKRNDGDEP